MRRKKEKRSKALKLVLIPILIGCFGLFCFKLYKTIKNSIWDGKYQINIAIDTGQFFLSSFDPKNQTLKILQLPENLYVKIPFGFGDYKIQALWGIAKLGAPIKKINKQEVVKRTLEDNLFFSPDALIKINNFSVPYDFKFDEKKVKKIIQPQTFFENLDKLKNLETNLTILDLVRLFFALNNVRKDKITVYNLEDLNVLEIIKLKNGTVGQKIKNEKLEILAPSFFKDWQIEEEGLKISIFNATGKEGIAKKAERLILAFGGDVIRIGTQREIIPKTICKISENKFIKSYTLKKIRKIFHCKFKREPTEGREDIILMIGLDY